jgi:glutathione synthase
MRKIKLAVFMDPIENIHIEKDTTFAMLLEAQKRNYDIYYIQPNHLYSQQGVVYAKACSLKVEDNSQHWFMCTEKKTYCIQDFDIILMRKDPPFTMDYIYTTYLLELAEKAGVLVINKPSGLRDANEKMFTTWFPECTPPTLVTNHMGLLKDFAKTWGDIIIKPLDGMGGNAILRLTNNDYNLSVGIELLTDHGKHYVMAQRYIPEIKQGDKRVLMIHGKPIPYALARIPQVGETRANLAAGGRGVVQALSERDQWICNQVGETLLEKGLYFVGLDIIGDYLTEINVTSPTCAREIEKISQIPIMSIFFEGIEKHL